MEVKLPALGASEESLGKSLSHVESAGTSHVIIARHSIHTEKKLRLWRYGNAFSQNWTRGAHQRPQEKPGSVTDVGRPSWSLGTLTKASSQDREGGGKEGCS